MHEALIEDAKYDKDRQQRGKDQDRLRTERLLKRLQRSGEKSLDSGWSSETFLHLGDKPGGIAERNVGRQIEGDGHRGEEPGVVHGERRGCRFDGCYGGQRYDPIAGGVQIDIPQPFGRLPEGRGHLKYDIVLIELSVDDGNFRLAES